MNEGGLKQGASAALAVAIVGTFLIVAGLVGVMRRHTQALVDAAGSRSGARRWRNCGKRRRWPEHAA
jgi:uncharacterized NAD(P)/FAD-binding protein YdhS